jgi:hypothetical protein
MRDESHIKILCPDNLPLSLLVRNQVNRKAPSYFPSISLSHHSAVLYQRCWRISKSIALDVDIAEDELLVENQKLTCSDIIFDWRVGV